MDDKKVGQVKTASQKINEGVTYVAFDALNAQVQDIVHLMRKFEAKIYQIELFSKRLQHMEFTMQKFENKAEEKIKAQDSAFLVMDEKLGAMEQQLAIIETLVKKNEMNIDNTIQSIFEFKNKMTMDVITNQQIVQKKLISLNDFLNQEQEKVQFLELQGTDVNIELQSLRKNLEFTQLKTNGIERLVNRIEKDSALKHVVEASEDIMKSQLGGIESQVEAIRDNLTMTDIYLERYLPCSILNIIHESTNGIISTYDDNKLFMENLDKKFKEMQQKIKDAEKFDAKQKKKKDWMNKLDKQGYRIPEIEIPMTLSSESSSEEEENESEQSQSQSMESDSEFDESENIKCQPESKISLITEEQEESHQSEVRFDSAEFQKQIDEGDFKIPKSPVSNQNEEVKNMLFKNKTTVFKKDKNSSPTKDKNLSSQKYDSFKQDKNPSPSRLRFQESVITSPAKKGVSQSQFLHKPTLQIIQPISQPDQPRASSRNLIPKLQQEQPSPSTSLPQAPKKQQQTVHKSKTKKSATFAKDVVEKKSKSFARSQTKEVSSQGNLDFLNALKNNLKLHDPNSEKAKQIKKELGKHMLSAIQNQKNKPKAADYTKIIKENAIIIEMQEQIKKLQENFSQAEEKNMEKFIVQEDRQEDLRYQLEFQMSRNKDQVNQRIEQILNQITKDLEQQVMNLQEGIRNNREEIIKGNFDIQKQVFLKISQQKSDQIVEFKKMQEAMGINSEALSPKINLNSLNKIIEMILQHLMVKNQIQFLNDDVELHVDDDSLNSRGELMSDRPILIENQQTKGYQYYSKERLQLQGKKVIETAWLVFQEINLIQDSVKTNTLKQLNQLSKENEFNEISRKMRILRPKWLPYDSDATLSFKAINLYDSIIKMNEKIDEQNLITKNVNIWLSNCMKMPQEKLFVIKTECLETEKVKDHHSTSIMSDNIDIEVKNSPKLFHNQSVISNPQWSNNIFSPIQSPLSLGKQRHSVAQNYSPVADPKKRQLKKLEAVSKNINHFQKHFENVIITTRRGTMDQSVQNFLNTSVLEKSTNRNEITNRSKASSRGFSRAANTRESTRVTKTPAAEVKRKRISVFTGIKDDLNSSLVINQIY